VIYLREEWLSRVKNDNRFPILSLNYLKSKHKVEDVMGVGHFQKPLRNWLLNGLEPNLSKINYLAKINQFRDGDIKVEKELKKFFGKKVPVFYCSHHLSHVFN
ncbi:uncharacterized protein METZ01_LOCUS515670, partial [marine metagenome]